MASYDPTMAPPRTLRQLVISCAFHAGFVLLGGLGLTGMVWVVFWPQWKANQLFLETAAVVTEKRTRMLHGDHGVYLLHEVRLRFAVAGVERERWNARIPSFQGDTKDDPGDAIRQMEVGQQLPCWYNPDDPDEVLIVRGYAIWSGLYVIAAGMAFFFLYGTAKIVRGFWSWFTAVPEQPLAFQSGPGPEAVTPRGLASPPQVKKHAGQIAGMALGDLRVPLRRCAERALDPQERLLWLGMPNVRGMMLREAVKSGCNLLLLLFLAAFAVGVLLLFGILDFPWVGAGAVVGVLCLGQVMNVYWSKWQAHRTLYLITDRRALILQAGWGGRLYVFPPGRLGAVKCNRLPDGSGEIIFEEKVQTSTSHDSEGHSTERTQRFAIGFIELDNVADPREALERLLSQPVPTNEVTTVEVREMPPDEPNS